VAWTEVASAGAMMEVLGDEVEAKGLGLEGVTEVAEGVTEVAAVATVPETVEVAMEVVAAEAAYRKALRRACHPPSSRCWTEATGRALVHCSTHTGGQWTTRRWLKTEEAQSCPDEQQSAYALDWGIRVAPLHRCCPRSCSQCSS
jgi:hypothetical protein